jgi:hypothetical protein
LYAARVAKIAPASSTAFGSANFNIFSSQARNSWSKPSGVAPANTSAVTHASATLGHFAFNSESILTIGNAPPLMLN